MQTSVTNLMINLYTKFMFLKLNLQSKTSNQKVKHSYLKVVVNKT